MAQHVDLGNLMFFNTSVAPARAESLISLKSFASNAFSPSPIDFSTDDPADLS